MKAKIITQSNLYNKHIGSEAKKFINTISDLISQTNCKEAFENLLGNKQIKQKGIIKDFQVLLCDALNKNKGNKDIIWRTEVLANQHYKDSFDLFCTAKLDNLTFNVIIELDKNRADQIAKKFISRISHTIDKPTIYIAFCYPGTINMSLNEAKKYFEFCTIIMNKISSAKNPKLFIGITTEN